MESEIEWLPTLYKFDNDGKLRRWTCGTLDDMYYTKSGLVWKADQSEGAFKPRKPKKIAATIINRTGEAAAKAHADQEWRKRQRKDTYHPYGGIPTCTPEEWREMHGDLRKWPAVCMDWQNLSEQDKVTDKDHPWEAQFKIDGDRCTAWVRDGCVHLYSRSCLEMKHKEEIRQQIYGIIALTNYVLTGNVETQDNYEFGLDGEIWAPKEAHHQHSRSIVARTVNKHDDEGALVFAWFDIMVYDKTTEERFSIIDAVKKIVLEDLGQEDRQISSGHDQQDLVLGGDFPNIFVVPHQRVEHVEDIYAFREYARRLGFEEGVVLRRPDLLYTTKKEWRNPQMVKFKYFEDAEFEVVGFRSAEGERAGCVVWELIDPKDMSIGFSCAQMGDLEFQRDLFNRGKEFLGKLITVRFMKRTADGIPYEPRALRFRPDEDLAHAESD